MRKSSQTPEQVRQIAAEAFRLCQAGDEAAGLARYRSIARPLTVPLGPHLDMLRSAGRASAAETLTQIILQKGGDLTWQARLRGGSMEATAAEYEALLARGRFNATMANGYLKTLTALGRAGDVAAIFDPARLLRRVRLAEPEPDAIARILLDREDAAMDVTQLQSVNRMRQVKRLQDIPAFATVLAACADEARAYQARWAASDHVLAHVVPRDFEISAWGLISRGEGYNSRHNHPGGWTTGVYYPVGLERDVAGGSLRVGGWRDPAPPGWPEAEIRPEAGLLVLMPSFYVHWTTRLSKPGVRLSIAFDASLG